MAIQIVDQLKVVNVDHDYQSGPPPVHFIGNIVVNLIIKSPPVVQVGQAVY